MKNLITDMDKSNLKNKAQSCFCKSGDEGTREVSSEDVIFELRLRKIYPYNHLEAEC